MCFFMDFKGLLEQVYSDIEDLWMSELYFEEREYEKSHLLFPFND